MTAGAPLPGWNADNEDMSFVSVSTPHVLFTRPRYAIEDARVES